MADVGSASPLPTGVRRALVVGLGASGRAAVSVLRAAGVEVLAVDDAADPPGVDEARAAGAEVVTGRPPADLVAEVGLVVPSPGVPEHAPVLAAAGQRGVEVWSEPELGWRLHPHRLIGITGTNGKTSTTELTAAMLLEGGFDAIACGNIGTPFSEAAALAGDETVLVAELSSFQLRFCHELRPEIGVLLNLAPDHLDWHGTEQAYGAAKARLWRAQQAGDHAVANADDPWTTALLERHAPAGTARFSGAGCPSDGPVAVGVVDGRLVRRSASGLVTIMDLDELPFDAPHHRANLAAAALAASLVGVADAAIAAAAGAFRPGQHRLELVATHDGIDYVDDSKATNPHAAAAALRSFPSIVWIAGGLAKGVDLGMLGDDLARVRHAVLIGAAADELATVCGRAGVPTSRAGSMDEAVTAAASHARSGDTVLLAPACASFDMFRDYADRGDRFAAAARALGEDA